ncbi:unnamed protein product [Owenia fusiformis]|uniref:Membrane protein BRI3 n=1 Tax=Owenia fusiformis TaxID=6347 RepID=A0A8J1U9D6_OWEFU|nr:unnamed protein product [Owenia fusiformis]
MSNERLLPEKPPEYTDVAGGYGAQHSQPEQKAGEGGYQTQPPAGSMPYQGGYPPQEAPVYPSQGNYPPMGQTYQQTTTVIHGQPQPTYTNVVVVGGCPACRVGVLEDDYTCLGVCCAIFFFPIGLLCCLAMRQRRCPNCGAIFG